MARFLGTTAWSIMLGVALLVLGLTAVSGFVRQHAAWTQLQVAGRVPLTMHMIMADLDAQQRLLERALAGIDHEPARLQRLSRQVEVELVRLEELSDRDLGNLVATWDYYINQRQLVLQQLNEGGQVQPPAEARELEVVVAFEKLRKQLQDNVVAAEHRLGASIYALEVSFWKWTVLTTLLTLLAMTLLLLYRRQVDERFKRPLQLMARLVERINLGELHRRLPAQQSAELNNLAMAVNRIVEHMQETDQEDRRRIQVEKELTTLLVEAFPEPTLVLNAANQVVLANEPGRLLFTGADGKAALGKLRAQIETEQLVVEFEKRQFDVLVAQPPESLRCGGKVVRLLPHTP